jgi:hypothetical protein
MPSALRDQLCVRLSQRERRDAGNGDGRDGSGYAGHDTSTAVIVFLSSHFILL